jgi:aspartate kinase
VRREIVVLKAGGASVKNPKQLAHWLKEEYRDPFILVVSAIAGRTDELIERLRGHTTPVPPDIQDALLSVGEQEAAALTAAALSSVGLTATVVPPWDVFFTDSEHGDARILLVNAHPICGALLSQVVPVIGGFIGKGADGKIRTLNSSTVNRKVSRFGHVVDKAWKSRHGEPL